MVTAKRLRRLHDRDEAPAVPTNISYADRDGNIVIFNGIAPKRTSGDVAFWRGLVLAIRPCGPRCTATRNCQGDQPRAGFVQNTNDPPWFPSWPTEVNPDDYPPYQRRSRLNPCAHRTRCR
jgi:acyl-homoserine-lactone acylase